MSTLLEELAKDREKFLAFLQYLIESGRLTEDEVIGLVRQWEPDQRPEVKNKINNSLNCSISIINYN